MALAHVWIEGEEANLIEVSATDTGNPDRIVEDAAWKALREMHYPYAPPLAVTKYSRGFWTVRDAVRIIAKVRWPVF